MSFERARRVDSNDIKNMWGSKWYELEMVKTYKDKNGQKSQYV